MIADRWQRLKELFNAVVELGPAERTTFLDEACRDDPKLRAEVEALVAVDTGTLGSGCFELLEGGALAAARWGAAAGGDSADPRGGSGGLVGRRIGKYLLRRVISSGGMGTVYEALQEQPRRVVAIKVMKKGLLSSQALRRFEYESQIMAMLRHPGIAQVVEAGTYRLPVVEGGAGGAGTDTGRDVGEDAGVETGADATAGVKVHSEEKPGVAAATGAGSAAACDSVDLPYIVMEYIPDARPITQYVKDEGLGVRERLELFTQVCEAVHHGHQKGVIHRDLKPANLLVDAQGCVKVIDFGIARATGSDLDITTMQTDVGQLLGTLQYMSPEQCKADPHDLDIRSDVYALGVVLFEVLCEELPYDVRRAALLEAARLIREEQPKKPSTASRTVSGDVETIVLKALEKERGHRYQTVLDLGGDIERFLKGQVILARRAGVTMRLWKGIRRNPVMSAAVAVVVLLCLSFFLYVVLWSYPQIRAEKEMTAMALMEARMEAEKSRAVNRFLETMLASADPYEAGRDVKVVDILGAASEKIEERFADQPQLEAALRATIGWSYLKLGQLEAAEPQLLAALETLRDDLGEGHLDTIEAMAQLGCLYAEQGRLNEAATLLKKVLDEQTQRLGEEHPETLQSMDNLACVLKDLSRNAEAEEMHRKVLAVRTRVLGAEHPETLRAMCNLSTVLFLSGNYSEAEPLSREALELHRRHLGSDHPDTICLMSNLACILANLARLEEADILHREALELRRRVFGAEHPHTLSSMSNLAVVLKSRGKLQEAEELQRRAADECSRILGEDHPDTLKAKTFLTQLLVGQKRFAEAEPLILEVIERSRRVLGPEHVDTLRAMNSLGYLYTDQEKFGEAERLHRDALESMNQVLAANHPARLETLGNLASVLLHQDKHAEAEPLLREQIELRREAIGENHPQLFADMSNLCLALVGQNKDAEAEALFLEAIDKGRRHLPQGHWFLYLFHMNYGDFLAARGRIQEARENLEAAHDGLKAALGEDHLRTRYARQQLDALPQQE